jgi:hypothetical protein
MTDRAIIDKIRKLLALAKGSTEHEAAAALAKAREIMDAHGVSDAHIAMAEIEEATARASRTQRPPRWEGILCAAVRRALGVEVFITACGDRTYVGRTPAAEIASYAFAVLFRRLKAARGDYIRTQLKRCGPARKRQRADIFCEGWAIAVFQKIAELMPEPKEDELIGRYLAERHPHLAPIGSRAATLKGRVAGNDYWRGREAGHDVQLHIGVGGSAAPLALPA